MALQNVVPVKISGKGHLRVAKNALDLVKPCAGGQSRGGVGVSEGVERDLGHSRPLAKSLQIVVHVLGVPRSAFCIQKDRATRP